MILLDALGGSHLYGLAYAGSDLDRYLVVDEATTPGHRADRHFKPPGDDDIIMATLSTFKAQADRGSHQALDAMFAPPEACAVDLIRDFREAYTAPTSAAFPIQRSVREMIHTSGDDRKARKRRRHGIRLILCANGILRSGRYQPRLAGTDLDLVRSVFDLSPGDVLELAESLSLLPISAPHTHP